MTTLLNKYSFMDLLKDNNYVPKTDYGKNSILQDIENAFNTLTEMVTLKTTEYDFMDLLNDNGYVPNNDGWLPKPCNDNDIILEAVV